MHSTGIVYFAVTLFLALAVLIKWKRRHDMHAARLNRGLRGYVAGTTAGLAVPAQTPRENPIPV